MKKFLILSVLFCALVVPSIALAAYFEADDNVSLPSSRTVTDNAYLAGNIVNVAGPVSGDVFVAGNTVIISGAVNRDIMAAGNTINIIGATAEDVRVAGNSVTLGGDFEGEVLAAGAQVTVLSETTIAGDANLAGASIVFDGNVTGDLLVGGVDKLVIGPAAIIGGNLEYSSAAEAEIDPAAQISGEVVFNETQGKQDRRGAATGVLAGVFTAFTLFKWAAGLLAAYLLWYIFRRNSLAVLQSSMNRFGSSLLKGLIFMVVVPVAAVIIAVTVIGAPIALFIGFVYPALLLLAVPFTILFAASLIFKKNLNLQWFHILIGAIVLAVVDLIPFLGWLTVFIVYLAALGGLLGVLGSKLRNGT